jgi:hypothetical protein
VTVRFRKIDDQNRRDHYYVDAGDECFYLWEYTAGKRYDYSETNQLISNLKKKRGQGGFQYKARANRRARRLLRPRSIPSG